MRLLLDTCTFLWIASGDAALSGVARDLFSDASNEVFLSSVSAWEIIVKHALGRLPLPRPPHEFVPEQRRRHRIEALALDETAVLQFVEVAGLPPVLVRPHAGLPGGGPRSHHSDARSGDLSLPRPHDLVSSPR